MDKKKRKKTIRQDLFQKLEIKKVRKQIKISNLKGKKYEKY